MEGLESVRGGNRGTDGVDDEGGRNTLLRSTAGFPGEPPAIWVVSLITSWPKPALGRSVVHFLALCGLELEGVGCGDTSQLVKSVEEAFLFALAGLELFFVCFALMDAAVAWTSPLHWTRVSSTTLCPGCGTVNRLVTIAISVSVSASFIARISRLLNDIQFEGIAQRKKRWNSGGSVANHRLSAPTSFEWANLRLWSLRQVANVTALAFSFQSL